MDDKEEFRGFDENDVLDPADFDEAEETAKDDDKPEAEETVEEKEAISDDDKEDEAEVKGDVDDEEEADEDDEATKKAKEAEKNHQMAEERRAREAKKQQAKEDEIKRAAKLEAELGIIKRNPYTDKPIVDEADLEAYKIMKSIDEEGGDPISDYPDKVIERDRKKSEEERKAREADEARRKKTDEEVAELAKAHPEADLSALAEDKEFINLCSDKGGRWTMLECYDYLCSKRANFKADEDTKKTDKKADEAAKKVSTPPSSKANGSSTSKSYMEMTDEEYIKDQKKLSDDFF